MAILWNRYCTSCIWLLPNDQVRDKIKIRVDCARRTFLLLRKTAHLHSSKPKHESAYLLSCCPPRLHVNKWNVVTKSRRCKTTENFWPLVPSLYGTTNADVRRQCERRKALVVPSKTSPTAILPCPPQTRVGIHEEEPTATTLFRLKMSPWWSTEEVT